MHTTFLWGARDGGPNAKVTERVDTEAGQNASERSSSASGKSTERQCERSDEVRYLRRDRQDIRRCQYTAVHINRNKE